eukprot:CAMPEP_0114490008 /NCGR_PEP_ID=MMETSP0109-20121206/2200_1 /TAXON_ID=29199 /ORGANISM="Chlorarachnion reptans, Strain CCCM449" /LENGTH=342 /DNA_ID=CAMNT_0001666571 /DNA_START=419 /DNA_END=1447 /DNA_ORIENTATION=-
MPELLELWRGFSKWIEKVDSFRFVLLEAYGGVYADLDVECLREPNFTRWGDECDVLLSESPYRRVQNSIMASKPKNGFWREVVSKMKGRLTTDLTREKSFLEKYVPFFQRRRKVHDSTGVTLLYIAYASSNHSICKLPCRNWEGRCSKCEKISERCNPRNFTFELMSSLLPNYTVHHGTQSWMRDSRLDDQRVLLTWVRVGLWGILALIVWKYVVWNSCNAKPKLNVDRHFATNTKSQSPKSQSQKLQSSKTNTLVSIIHHRGHLVRFYIGVQTARCVHALIMSVVESELALIPDNLPHIVRAAQIGVQMWWQGCEFQTLLLLATAAFLAMLCPQEVFRLFY